ncbi:MAG: hypothetical protein CBB71_08965 [Rhodopirellula sp. TMED11]|nr:MAG: hypothetical protein CBB71_08965 [Rhodopirellula sp. TMED11]
MSQPHSSNDYPAVAGEDMQSSVVKPGLGKATTSGLPSRPAITTLLRKLAGVVGQQHVLTQRASREQYAKSTLPQGTTPLVIVRPDSLLQVSRIMPLLSEAGLAWKAISRGKNWGYGDACASQDGAVILDLGRMNQIVEINEELGYAVIEAGVSQGQLYQELQRRKSALMMDVTGAGPDASIVGNVLQRGFGHTPYGDRSSKVSNYQYVTPDGKVLHTGFGKQFFEPDVAHVYPNGRGPNPQGMLQQSDLAVVTRMTVWLMPRPDEISGFAFRLQTPEQFQQAVNAVGQLRQRGTIDSVVHFANDLRTLSSRRELMAQFPGDEVLTASNRNSLRNQGKVAPWNALGGLYGTRQEVKAKRAAIRAAFRGISKPIFFSKRHLALTAWAVDHLPPINALKRLRHLQHTMTDVFDLLSGVPSKAHLEGAFFRHRPESGQVQDVGLVWFAPVVPMRGPDVSQLIEAIEPIANRYGFDLPVTVSPVVARAAVCVTNLSFDKNDDLKAKQAAACYREMKAVAESLGCPVYRSASIEV